MSLEWSFVRLVVQMAAVIIAATSRAAQSRERMRSRI